MFEDRNEKISSDLMDMSVLSMHYYKQLLAQGFSEKQATQMVYIWQKAMFGGVK